MRNKIIILLVLVTMVFLLTNCLDLQEMNKTQLNWSLNEQSNKTNVINEFKESYNEIYSIKNWEILNDSYHYSIFNNNLFIKINNPVNQNYGIFISGDDPQFSIKQGYNINSNLKQDYLITFYNQKNYGVYSSLSNKTWKLQNRHLTFVNQLNDSYIIGIPLSEINVDSIQQLSFSYIENNSISPFVSFNTNINLNKSKQVDFHTSIVNDISLNIKYITNVQQIKGQKLIVSTTNLQSGQDTILTIKNSNNEVVQENDDYVGLASYVEYVPEKTEELIVYVTQWKDKYIGSFDLHIFQPPVTNTTESVVFEDNFNSASFHSRWQRSNQQPTLQTQVKHSGGYGVKFNGTNVHNSRSTLSTNVTLNYPGKLSFFFRTSSEYGYDHLSFYVNNILVGRWSGNLLNFQYFEFSFKSQGNYNLKWEYSKDGSVHMFDDTQWLDTVRVVEFREEEPPPQEGVDSINESFNNGNLNSYPWVVGGHTPPFVQGTHKQNGTYGLQFGQITHNQRSSISITVTIPQSTEISFYVRTSSERNYDFLSFFVGNTRMGRWSGNMTTFERQNYTIPQGTHILRWEYSKDRSVNSFMDTQWVDNIQMGSSTNPEPPQPFTYVSPQNQANLTQTSNIQFRWNQSQHQTRYMFQFGSQLNSFTILANDLNTTQYTLTQTLTNGTYYWRVIAINDQDQYVGPTFTFTVQQTQNPPQAFTYVSPQNQSSTTQTNVQFQWNQSQNQTTYMLQLGTSSNNLVTVENSLNTTTHTRTLTPGTYYWRVLQNNDVGSALGPIWSFTITGNTPPPPDDDYVFFDDFRTGNLSGWNLSGNTIPFVQSTEKYQGNHAMQFGRISHNQHSRQTIQVNVTQQQYLRFQYKVSSEQRYDFLYVYVNNNVVFRDSGNSDWQLQTIPLQQGNYTIHFEYRKDGSVSHYQDTQWVDVVNISYGQVSNDSRVDRDGPVYDGNVLIAVNYSINPNDFSNTGNLYNMHFIDKDDNQRQIDNNEMYPINILRPLPEDHKDYPVQTQPRTIVQNQVGSTKQFWVFNFVQNRSYQINFTLMAVGNHSEVWVENPSQINSTRQGQIRNEFENRIYPTVSQYFYHPSNVGGNGKTQILCYDIQDGFNGSGGYIAGYFWGGDLLSVQNSNRNEVIHIDTYPSMIWPQGSQADVSRQFSTIAHEFQHLVNFHQNYIVEGTEMDIFLNEGLSMQAEHMLYGTLQNRINFYNNNNIYNSILRWEQNLGSYSLAYLFVQYIRTQTTVDPSIYRQLITDPLNDFRVVERYMDTPLQEVLVNFRVQTLLKDPTGEYGFNGESWQNSIQQPISGLTQYNLRGGAQIYKNISGGSFTENGTQGNNIRFIGVRVE